MIHKYTQIYENGLSDLEILHLGDILAILLSFSEKNIIFLITVFYLLFSDLIKIT